MSSDTSLPSAASTRSADSEQPASTRQYVTFTAANEVFAVEMGPVQEIIRMPNVARVPLSPPSVLGLANLRGKILPIVSLRRTLGLPEVEVDENARAVVIDIGQPLGFVVDQVSSVVAVDESKIEGVQGITAAINTDMLCGLIKDVGDHAMVMLLDFRKLIEREFAQMAEMQKNQGRVGSGRAASASGDEQGVSTDLRLVSFDIGGQEYAIPIEHVQEIVHLTQKIVKVPNSQSHVLGVMTLRNGLLPLVSLRHMFSLQASRNQSQSRVLVVTTAALSVGVVVDNVREVLRVSLSDVEVMPGMLARESDMADISEICRLEDGKRLVSIISIDNLFRDAAIKEALTNVSKNTDIGLENGGNATAATSTDEQLVVFRLGGEEFAVPIDCVQEILRVPESLTHVPKSPPSVEGVVNLRGSVLPVLDLRRRLSLKTLPRNDAQRIMVLLINGGQTGFIVDSVVEVLKVPQSQIEPSPSLSSVNATLLSRMVNLEQQKRMVQLIDAAHLLDDVELGSVAEIAT